MFHDFRKSGFNLCSLIEAAGVSESSALSLIHDGIPLFTYLCECEGVTSCKYVTNQLYFEGHDYECMLLTQPVSYLNP